MTEFEFRTLAREPYRKTVQALESVVRGDPRAFADLSSRARIALDDPELRRLNARSGQLGFWRDWLDEPHEADAATAEKLGEIAVAALCMPGFQTYPLAGETPSPHLVLLGDSDGGLFGVLEENLDWFEPWLSDGLAHRAEAYGYGRNMFSATAGELMRLSQSLGLEPECDQAPIPDDCRAALARLATLIASARSGAELTVAVSETG